MNEVSDPETRISVHRPIAAQTKGILDVSQVMKEGRALDESREVVVVRFQVASARPESSVKRAPTTDQSYKYKYGDFPPFVSYVFRGPEDFWERIEAKQGAIVSP